MSGYIGPAPVPQATQTRQTFTATSGQTSFATVGYVAGGQFIQVYLNGVLLKLTDDYTAANGSDISLTSGAATGDVLEFISFADFTVNNQNFTGGLTVDNDGSTVLTVDRATSDGTIIDVQKSGSSVGSIGATSGYLTVTASGGSDAGAKLGNSAIFPCNTDGSDRDAGINLGLSTVRWKDLYLSGGVYLGGVGSANKLDDYEEGAFSPMTSTEANVYHARYTKIGNLVTINCCFNMKSGQSRDNISLPFTPLNDGVGKNTASNDATNNRYSGSVSFFEASTSVTNLMLFHQGNQGASAYFIAQSGSMQWPEAITDAEYNAVAVNFTYQTS